MASTDISFKGIIPFFPDEIEHKCRRCFKLAKYMFDKELGWRNVTHWQQRGRDTRGQYRCNTDECQETQVWLLFTPYPLQTQQMFDLREDTELGGDLRD